MKDQFFARCVCSFTGVEFFLVSVVAESPKNKVPQTHKRDGDVIDGDEVRLRRGELQISTFVMSTDASIAFLFSSSLSTP